MGRPEKQIPDPLSPLGRLAVALRNGRRHVGLSYAELAERTRFHSPGTLQRAASGTTLPKLETAQAFARACGLDADEITRMWIAAYRGTKGGGHKNETPAPQPGRIKDFPGLCRALEELRQVNGAPSFQILQNRARAAGAELSRSTAYRICAGQQPPASLGCLEAFLIACEVPPRERTVWAEAWVRARKHDAQARQDTDASLNVKDVEAVIAGNTRGEVTQKTAQRLLRRAGLGARERYRRFETPWTVECLQCAATFRIRLSDVVLGRAACPDCPRLNDHVREAWAELLANRTGTLSRQQVRALRAVTVLQARQQGAQLDVPVFVADRRTGAVLRSPAWHPALEACLRRHVRRPFHLDVIIVYDYDTVPTPRNGQRQRRLAKAAGLVDGPLETPRSEDEPPSADPTAPAAPVPVVAQRDTVPTTPRPAVHPSQDSELPWASNSGP
jgi:transcriptional regulator with XRE-family HTH domain